MQYVIVWSLFIWSLWILFQRLRYCIQNNNSSFSTLFCTSFPYMHHRETQPHQLASREILPRGQKLHLVSFRTAPPLGAAMHAQTQRDCRWFLARVFWHTSQRFDNFDFGCLSNQTNIYFSTENILNWKKWNEFLYIFTNVLNPSYGYLLIV